MAVPCSRMYENRIHACSTEGHVKINCGFSCCGFCSVVEKDTEFTIAEINSLQQECRGMYN
jgi:hypothetical protein